MAVSVRQREAERAIRRHLGSPDKVRRLLQPPSPDGFRTAAGRLERSIRDLAKEPPAASPLMIAASVLYAALYVLLPYMEGRVEEAARRLVEWQKTMSEAEHLPGGALDKLYRLYLETAAAEAESVLQGSRGEEVIERFADALRLSYDDVGRMLGVSGETVRRWARGATRVPDRHLARLDLIGASLDRLLQLFLPERLPRVIRRPADLFDGDRALDWILRGRIEDVVDRYDSALMYQG